jgi:dCTP deaminase
MIPSDELVEALADPKSGFSITPLIDAAGQIGEGSVDIRLGPDIIVSPRATGATAFDPVDGRTFRRNLEQRQEYVRRGIGDPFQIQPGEFVIGRSLEYVMLPEDVSAEALGRSSWGRLGLVIATATLIQPGFKGTITLELANVGDTPIVLTVGLSIAQLIFSRGGPAPEEKTAGLELAELERVREWRRRHHRRNKSKGRYKLQIKPALSRLDGDEDLRWVTPLAVRYVLGVVGLPYAGKSTMVDFLTTHRHFRLYRLTQFIFEEARRRGLEAEDKRILKSVGDDLREKHGDATLSRLAFERMRGEMLDPDRSRELTPIALEGFRVAEELRVWQKIEMFRPVVVHATVTTRRKRAVERGWLDQEQLGRLGGYPKGGSEEEKDQWFVEAIDPPDSSPRRELIELAAQDPKAIVIDNEFGSVRELQQHLKEQVVELEKWWRTREY